MNDDLQQNSSSGLASSCLREEKLNILGLFWLFNLFSRGTFEARKYPISFPTHHPQFYLYLSLFYFLFWRIYQYFVEKFIVYRLTFTFLHLLGL